MLIFVFFFLFYMWVACIGSGCLLVTCGLVVVLIWLRCGCAALRCVWWFGMLVVQLCVFCLFYYDCCAVVVPVDSVCVVAKDCCFASVKLFVMGCGC